MIMSNFLGNDLIVNIVSRLPAESVLLCRCVCKRWRALLHEFYFVQIHTDRTLLQQQHIDDQSSSRVSLFMLVNPINNTTSCSYECHLLQGGVNSSSSSSSSHKVLNPFPPPPSRYYSFAVIKWSAIGSINGLICLYGVNINCHLSCPELKALIIYNPITKEYLNLPAAAVAVALAGDHKDGIKDARAEAIGFGYHPSTKEYKIVIIVQGHRWLHVMIYTLGSKGKWRISKVDVPPAETYQVCSHGSVAKGTHVNGAIYWLTESHTIVSFNLEDEKFRIIHAPHSARCCFKILGGGERLCVVCMVQQNSQDIWVMNINGNQYSWTKEFSIPVILGTGIQVYELIAFGTGAAGRDRVVCLCESDKQRSKFLISFDCRTKTLKSLGDIKASWSLIDITCCTKSLVSLKTLGEEDAKLVQPAATTKTQIIKLLGFAMVTIQLLQFTSIISAAFVC